MLLQQAFDDGRAAHLLGIVVDVVPHHELVEREQTEQRLFHNVPFWMVHQVAAHDGKNFLHIDAVLVFGQGRQSGQADIVLLFQHLHQGGVERYVLVAGANHVVVAAAAHDVNGQQQQRGVAWADALVGLEPFQQAQHEEQRVGAVLFQCCSRGAEESLQGVAQFVFVQIRADFVVFQVFQHHRLQFLLIQSRVVDAKLVGGDFLFRGAGQNLIVAAVVQIVLEVLDLIGDKGHHLLAHAYVHQVVAQREVEQLALPYLLAGQLALVFFGCNIGHVHGLHTLGGVLVLDAVGLPLSVDAHGQRTYALEPAAVDVAEQYEAVFIGNDMVLSVAHGVFESHFARCCQVGGLHEYHLADAVADGF